jgi:hypothetical protein
MHRVILAWGLLSTTSLALAQARLEEKAQPRIVKPAPIVATQTPFQLKVETKSRFPNENRPGASTPAEEKSLAVTIQPEKSEFAGNGPLAFAVTFENKSPVPLMLFGLEHLGVSPKLVISNQANANQWSITGSFAQDKNQAAIQLGAGESKTYTLVVEANVVIPQPIPLPRPMPFPVPAVEKGPAVNPRAVQRIFPPRPPWVIGTELPCGEGACRALLLLEFQTDPLRRYLHPLWSGKIASGTVDFQVGKPLPIVVPPIGGGPLTKERAIVLAQAAAELALKSNYQPLAGIKPVHQGAWITDATKTAEVTEQKAGGWTIGWTEFPKQGFSFNVKIDVNTNGATTVREVFTSYTE